MLYRALQAYAAAQYRLPAIAPLWHIKIELIQRATFGCLSLKLTLSKR